MAKRVIVFAPHPDDETLGCGGTIVQKLNEGCDVTVVFMTDGRHSLDGLVNSRGPTPLEIRTIRRNEATKAARILGIPEENLLFLDFEDQKLQENDCEVQAKIVRILQDFFPEEVFFPQEKEFNGDHRVTNVIIKRALRMLDLHPVEYQYIIAWYFPFYLYQRIMPRSIFNRVVRRFSKYNQIQVDISKVVLLKEKALKEYQSQILRMFTGQRRPVLKNSFVKRFLIAEESFLMPKDAKNKLFFLNTQELR